LRFSGLPFFIGDLLNEPLCVFWGCLFFHGRSFE
jgi:hypothetical protein